MHERFLPAHCALHAWVCCMQVTFWMCAATSWAELHAQLDCPWSGQSVPDRPLDALGTHPHGSRSACACRGVRLQHHACNKLVCVCPVPSNIVVAEHVCAPELPGHLLPLRNASMKSHIRSMVIVLPHGSHTGRCGAYRGTSCCARCGRCASLPSSHVCTCPSSSQAVPTAQRPAVQPAVQLMAAAVRQAVL